MRTRIAKTPRGNRTRERHQQSPPHCPHLRALGASAAAAAPSPVRATTRGMRVGTIRGMRASRAVDQSEPRELPRAWRRPKGFDVHVSDQRPSCTAQMMRRALTCRDPGLGCCPARAPCWSGGPRRRRLHCCPWRREAEPPECPPQRPSCCCCCSGALGWCGTVNVNVKGTLG